MRTYSAPIALAVALAAGATPALALNPQPLPPLEGKFHAFSASNKLDCSSAQVHADGKLVDAADFTATEDASGGCDVNAKLQSNVKFFHVKFATTDGKTRSFFIRFAKPMTDDGQKEMSIEK